MKEDARAFLGVKKMVSLHARALDTTRAGNETRYCAHPALIRSVCAEDNRLGSGGARDKKKNVGDILREKRKDRNGREGRARSGGAMVEKETRVHRARHPCRRSSLIKCIRAASRWKEAKKLKTAYTHTRDARARVHPQSHTYEARVRMEKKGMEARARRVYLVAKRMQELAYETRGDPREKSRTSSERALLLCCCERQSPGHRFLR